MKNSKLNILKVLAVFAAFAAALAFCGKLFTYFAPVQGDSGKGGTSLPSGNQAAYSRALEDYEENGMKAMWISYLEYMNMDFSTRESFTGQIQQIFTRCKDMGLNTVIVHTRPFGDAFYPSDYFPYSHLLTGTQGQNPGYDPLAIMVDCAHSTGLRIEAWVNPYRVRLPGKPPRLSADNPAIDTSLTIAADGGIYYNPALPRVRQLVVNGVVEIVEKYHVDGIHFDDYFYPGTDPALDSRQYALYSGNLSLEDWRRENVNALIREVYAAVKQTDDNVVFGISPQGNDDNNYNTQYSDVALWLSTPGYADYIMPQLYWGFDYTTASGSDRFAFKNISYSWSQYKKTDGVKLYIGLGAYRIGAGDGSHTDSDEWTCGNNLAKMIDVIKANPNLDGYALYRYDNLFGGGEYARLQRSEVQAITNRNR